jgi:hypothetical protein
VALMAALRSSLTAAAALLIAAPGFAGDIFRCELADGRILFTHDRSACPDAKLEEGRSEVQRYAAPPAPAPSPQHPAAPGSNTDSDAIRAASWQNKRSSTERKLEKLRTELAETAEVAEMCRAHYVFQRDPLTGIKERVNCSELREEMKSLRDQIAEAEMYLEEGLEEECRKAGCLPGWIRAAD